MVVSLGGTAYIAVIMAPNLMLNPQGPLLYIGAQNFTEFPTKKKI